MNTTDTVNKLFMDTSYTCTIKHIYQNGFNKYIIFNKLGVFFVIGFNPTTKRYGFGCSPLMLQEYKIARLSADIMPDYAQLYKHVERVYKIQQKLKHDLKPLFDLVDKKIR